MQDVQAMTISDLTVDYAGSSVLSIPKLSAGVGEFVAILGPNGAGKSTFVKSLLNLLAFKGKIQLDCKENRISYLPQQQTIDWNFPITVSQAVSLSSFKRVDPSFLQQILQKVGIAELSDRPIRTLSGGQRQRLLLARLLIRETDLLILDEPFTGLDSFWQEKVYTILREKQVKGNLILLVTHDLPMAQRFCTRLIFINQGKITADYQNTPEIDKKIESKMNKIASV